MDVILRRGSVLVFDDGSTGVVEKFDKVAGAFVRFNRAVKVRLGVAGPTVECDRAWVPLRGDPVEDRDGVTNGWHVEVP